MNIVLIGGFGWIGLHLTKRLAKNHDVVVIDPHELTTEEREFLSEQAKNIKCFNDRYWSNHIGIIRDYFQMADVIVSLPGELGSIPSVKSFLNNLNHSIYPHLQLLDALRMDGLTPLIIFPSSDLTHCYPPRCMYTVNKLYIEDALRIAYKVYGIPYVALRMATGYGPMQRRDSVINFYIRRGLEGGEIPIWGDGFNRQAFIYADDMVRAFEMACEGKFPVGVYPLVGHNSMITEIAHAVEYLVGGKVVKIPFPELTQKVNVGDLPIDGNPPGFEPEIDLAKGIELTAKWMKKQNLLLGGSANERTTRRTGTCNN